VGKNETESLGNALMKDERFWILSKTIHVNCMARTLSEKFISIILKMAE
jgi:hypothetical protein